MKAYLCTITLVLSLVTLVNAQQRLGSPMVNFTPFSPSIIPYLAGPPKLSTPGS